MYDRHVSVGRLKVAGVSALSTENVLLVYWNPLLLVISMPPSESLNVTLR